MYGGGSMMAKVSAVEAPPPGPGLNTVTRADPAEAMSAIVMVARSWLLPMKVVVRLEPFQRTTEPFRKFDPTTTRVKAASPAIALEGDIEESAGTGLLMVKMTAFEVPPPGVGLNTVTCAVPAAVTSLDGIVARTCVALRKVLERFWPFQRTTDPEMKLLPFTVSVKVPPTEPATTLLGESEETCGTGLGA